MSLSVHRNLAGVGASHSLLLTIESTNESKTTVIAALFFRCKCTLKAIAVVGNQWVQLKNPETILIRINGPLSGVRIHLIWKDWKIEIEGLSHQKSRWTAFYDFLEAHYPEINRDVTCRNASRGTALLQQLRDGREVAPFAIEEKLSNLFWGLTLESDFDEEPFDEPIFEIHDPEHRIFRYFFPFLEGIHSKDYKTRAIAPFAGFKHFSIDLAGLPGGVRTIVMGKITSADGRDSTYFKMAKWRKEKKTEPSKKETLIQYKFLGSDGFQVENASDTIPWANEEEFTVVPQLLGPEAFPTFV